MFLTTLMSDAAAQHGHEFSAPRPTTPNQLSPLPRARRPKSALHGTRPSLANASTRKPAGAGEAVRGEKVMFKEEAEVKVLENLRKSLEESSEEETQRPSIEMRLADHLNQATPTNKRTKKQLRPKTTYTFAHTVARVNALHKLKSRPPAVLQLHQVTADARPRPAFEVFSSGRYAKKLGRNLSRLHKGRDDKLSTDDVVLCKAHEYDAHEDDWESQEVAGVVYASYKDERRVSSNAQLCLADGSSWEAIPHEKGRFDFVSTDEHGITRVVRWVPRRVRSRQSLSMVANPTHGGALPTEEVVYRFSTIDPRTRRHPVIATMTPKDLEISDTYYMPRSSPQTAQDHVMGDTDDNAPLHDERLAERELLHTAPLLRTLILLSGVYIALFNNWSPVFAYKKDCPRRTDTSKPGSCNTSVRSPNCSPTPSMDRIPFGMTRRHTFDFRRRSSTNATTSATSTNTALGSAFTDHSNTEQSIPSRSTTPDSRLRRVEYIPNSMARSAIDRPFNRYRQMSHTTESGESTTAEGSEFSLPNGVRTPTPSARLGAIDGGIEEPFHVRRSGTLPNFLNRAGSRNRRWRTSSDASHNFEITDHGNSKPLVPTVVQETDEDPPTSQRRRFSLSRGRTRQRPEKNLTMIDHAPTAYQNPQWWMDWGAETAASPQAPSALDDATPGLTARQVPAPLHAQLIDAEQTPRRNSFSIHSWRKRATTEGPRSVFVPAPSIDDKMLPVLDRDDFVLQSLGASDVQKRDNVGFGGIVRRMTHRLRREERKLG